MNWNVFIKLLLPIRYRVAKLLIAVLSALTKVARSNYDNDFAWVQNLIMELKYTSQVKSMIQLLNDKFDPISRVIVIEDGTDGNVSIVGDVEDDIDLWVMAGEDENIFIARNEDDTSVGDDFIVKVPSYVSCECVKMFIRRYIFAGVGFKVVNL